MRMHLLLFTSHEESLFSCSTSEIRNCYDLFRLRLMVRLRWVAKVYHEQKMSRVLTSSMHAEHPCSCLESARLKGRSIKVACGSVKLFFCEGEQR